MDALTSMPSHATRPFATRPRLPSMSSTTSDPRSSSIGDRRLSLIAPIASLPHRVGTFRFFDLPAELRECVYGYLTPDVLDVERLCKQLWFADVANIPRAGHFVTAFSAKQDIKRAQERVSEEHPALRGRSFSIAPAPPFHIDVNRQYAAEVREYMFNTTILRLTRDSTAWEQNDISICFNAMFGLPVRLVNLHERTRQRLPHLRDFMLSFRNVHVSLSRLADSNPLDLANPLRSSPGSVQAHRQRLVLEPWTQVSKLLDARIQRGPLHLTLDSRSILLTGSRDPSFDEAYTSSRRELLALLQSLVASSESSVCLIAVMGEKTRLGPKGSQGRLQLDWLEKRIRELEKAEAERRQKLGLGEELNTQAASNKSTKKEKLSLGFKLFMRYYR